MRRWRSILMSGGDFDAFEWDPKKSDETFRMRGFDFATAALVFGGIYLEYEDQREDYGEQRNVVTGIAGDNALVLVVVWTPRGRNCRILSARLAEQREREEYGRFRGVL